MNKREFERKTRIEQVKKTILKAKEKGSKIDSEKFIYFIMGEYGCAKRTAMEYIKTAEVMVDGKF